MLFIFLYKDLNFYPIFYVKSNVPKRNIFLINTITENFWNCDNRKLTFKYYFLNYKGVIEKIAQNVCQKTKTDNEVYSSINGSWYLFL